jgi:hypothetical protein
VSRPVLRPTQPPVQWVLGVLSRLKHGLGVTLTTYPHLAQMSRMSRTKPPFSLVPAGHSRTALLSYTILSSHLSTYHQTNVKCSLSAQIAPHHEGIRGSGSIAPYTLVWALMEANDPLQAPAALPN